MGSDDEQRPVSVHPWSLVYSGDTRPCEEVVYAGRGHMVPATEEVISRVPYWGSREDCTDGDAGGIPGGSGAHGTSGDDERMDGARTAPTTSCSSSWVEPQEPAAFAAARARVSEGCTVLIHEATFEHDEQGAANAVMKKHTTVGEACAVAEGSCATHTVLTHFSARYPKLPVLKMPDESEGSDINATGTGTGTSEGGGSAAAPSASKNGASSTGTGTGTGRTLFVSYDLMSVRGDNVRSLPALLPALHVLFAEEAEAAGGEEDGPPDEAAVPHGDAF